MPFYCPVDGRYSDKFPTAIARDNHIVQVHPTSPEAQLIIERRRKGYASSAEVGKTTPTS